MGSASQRWTIKSFMAKPATLCSSVNCFSWSLRGVGCSNARYYDQNSFSVELPSWAQKNCTASATLLGRSANPPGELQTRVSKIYLLLANLLCRRKALPTAICLACWISSRALYDSIRASLISWRALASLDSWSKVFCSKDSHLVMASLSSC